MILGLYKKHETSQGFEGSFWRVSDIFLHIGNIEELKAECVIKCFKDYNFSNINPYGYIESLTICTDNWLNEIEYNLFNQYFVGSANPIEVQDSYYNFFKNEHPFFEDAIIIDTDAPETMQYLGENPNIIIPQNLQQGE